MTGLRHRRCGALLALVLLVGTACATEDETPSAKGEATADDTELVVAAGKDESRTIPPFAANVATGFGNANAPVCETLADLSEDFTPTPLLADSWVFNGPNTWRLRLHDGVTFHNGAPFDANAVVANVQRWAEDEFNPLSVGPDSAVVVDATTVDITPTKPNLHLVEQLTHPLRCMLAPGTVAGDGKTPADTPTGTGPFEFESYEPGSELRVVRNDDYWGAQAKAQRITFVFVEDDATRVLKLEKGEVDAIYDFPRELASRFADHPDIVTVKSAPGGYSALLLNLRGQAPYDILNDRTVRQAVAYGIDRATIVGNVWQGNAEETSSLIPDAVLGDNAGLVKGYPFQPAEAERLLDTAGWVPGSDGIRVKDGRRLELTLVVVEAELQKPAPELVQSQLKEIGIDVKLELPSDPGAYFDRLTQGQGDMFAEVGSQNDANPLFLGAPLASEEVGGFPGYGNFGAGAGYDQLLLKASSSLDTGEVRRLAAEAMAIAVDDVVAVVPIAGIDRIWGLRRNVEGFTPHPSAASQNWNEVHASP